MGRQEGRVQKAEDREGLQGGQRGEDPNRGVTDVQRRSK